jgi:predicted SprT family Zn-dependent metalloprotease
MDIEILKQKFDEFNREKFENKLPSYKISIRKMHYFGRVNFKKKTISIRVLERDDESILNTLLHEMIHAELHRRGCRNKSHSVKFWRMFAEKGGIITENNKQLYAKARSVAEERVR